MNNKQEKEGECDVWRDLATHQCCIRNYYLININYCIET